MMVFGPAVLASDARFTVIPVDPTTEDLQLFWGDEQGMPFRDFDALSAWVQGQGKSLVFGMNAGMYHANAAPVGLLVMAGKQVAPLNLSNGFGNFFLKPNGVFLWSPSGPQVVDATEYAKRAKDVRFATQSGPLLLKSGVIHPAFNANSSSRLIRNGVGVSGGKAIFVISEQPVNFHEFATYFRDVLKCKDALYLDGTVSILHSEKLKRSDHKYMVGPIAGVIR
ncbi:MAG: hypothetical protein RLZZ618_3309 [Pseudomonadota bacterium]